MRSNNWARVASPLEESQVDHIRRHHQYVVRIISRKGNVVRRSPLHHPTRLDIHIEASGDKLV